MSDFRQIAKELEKELQAARKAARQRFVYNVAGLHKGIVQKFYTAAPGASVGLARRTGAAAKSWAYAVAQSGDTIVGTVYSAGVSYANMSTAKTITPKKAKWLAIPVGPALTRAGVPRYPDGPNQAAQALRMPPKKQPFRRSAKARAITNPRYSKNEGQRDPLRFYKKSADTAFLIAKDGVTGTGITKKNRILFVLKKKVIRPARTAGLMPFVDKRVEQTIKSMSNDIFTSRK